MITLKPKSKKLNRIIERTAHFVAEQGAQMEILIKMKQSDNANFQFLSHDSSLHPYYRLILHEIKTGRYTPNVSENQPANDGSGDDGSGDEGYLHPSLLSSNTVNNQSSLQNLNLNKNITADSHYSKLVQDFKSKFADDIVNAEEKKLATNSDSKKETSNVTPIGSSLLPVPPEKVEKIITKLAEYVAKSGQSFEASIKDRKDEKFDFVNKGHLYHPYYVKQKIHFAKLYGKKLPMIKPEETANFVPNNKTVAFSIQKPSPKQSNLRKIPPCDEDEGHQSEEGKEKEDDASNKILQQIRKQKLKLFLKNIEKNETEAGSSKQVQTYGPQLPVKTKSVELSPTTKAITDLDFGPMSSQVRSPSGDSWSKSKNAYSPPKVFSNSPPRHYKDYDDDNSVISHYGSGDERRTTARYIEYRKKKKTRRGKARGRSGKRKQRLLDQSSPPESTSEHGSNKEKHKHRRHRETDHSHRDKNRKTESSEYYRHRSRSRSRSRSHSRS